ncbi:hypothetical protein NP233_g10051 [Leucocoprinus birnbaumii]|uniref:Nephrocystin 3-like N-terminal domain-containing protein n=1 Tax=Leucocoprinus birnbaumii TaxID=56174 RepID=A0AAD5VJ20_9AGAR|nr:hypothetical protein NP233_g10051 [Leucocoprinus birnbaumii]
MSDVPSNSNRMFDGAHDMAFYHPTFVSNTTNHLPGKQGLAMLLARSMRDAFHDSSDRWPPPRCHYDSRQELRKTITDWGTGQSEASSKQLLWMHGPFGVGKSAVAQNSAEAFEKLEKLAASLFFSRPNRRNDPIRIFTSIIYQLVLKFPELADILDQMVLSNPTILTAALPRQFEELVIKPLCQISPQLVADMEGWVIILDGFDEIDGIEEQCDIIDIIVGSIRDRATPFRWFILSRPEPHIQRAMGTADVTSLLHTLDLPLSPENDHEILTFLMKELQEIAEKHKLPPSWCTEVEFAILVKLAGGLWIYVHMITRFIGDAKSFGPRAQLRLVLSLSHKERPPPATNPLVAIDLFYNLIIEQIPVHILLTVRKILFLQGVIREVLATSERWLEILVITNILQLHFEEFSAACGFLQSVLFIVNDKDRPSHIQFYHASFMEYASDSGRSKKFCILGDLVDDIRLEVIERVNSVHSCSTGDVVNISFTTWELNTPEDESKPEGRDALIYYKLICSMFALCERHASTISPLTAEALQNVAFSHIPRFARGTNYANMQVKYSSLRDNLPSEYRAKIIRKSIDPLHLNKAPDFLGNVHAFILGTAPNGLVCWPQDNELNDIIDIRFDDGEYLLYETESNTTPDAEEIAASEPEMIMIPVVEDIATPNTQGIVPLEAETMKIKVLDTKKSTPSEADKIKGRHRWVPKWLSSRKRQQ